MPHAEGPRRLFRLPMFRPIGPLNAAFAALPSPANRFTVPSLFLCRLALIAARLPLKIAGALFAKPATYAFEVAEKATPLCHDGMPEIVHPPTISSSQRGAAPSNILPVPTGSA